MDVGQEHVQPVQAGGIEKYPLWALDNTVEGPERNIPDAVLRGVWRRMVQGGKDKLFFYGGQVHEEEQWLDWVKSPHNSVIFQIDRDAKEICLFAVLNGFKDAAAQGHFCSVLPYQRGMGQGILDFWAGLKDCRGKPILKVVWGSTPEGSRAVKLITLLGFTVIGTIPHSCRLEYEQRTVGAAISYLDLEERRNG
jgi:hypothetical protein